MISSEMNRKWPNSEEVYENYSEAKSATNFNRSHGAQTLPRIQLRELVRVRIDQEKI